MPRREPGWKPFWATAPACSQGLQPPSVTTVLADDEIAPWRVVGQGLAIAVCGLAALNDQAASSRRVMMTS